jgi:hypothetical protein
MVNLEYHKGSFCIYVPRFCQEGYCSQCEIYAQRSVFTKPDRDTAPLKNTRKLQEVGIK